MNNYIAVAMTVLGILLLILAYIVDGTVFSVVQEILLIIGWVLLWDMLESILIDNNKRKIKRLNKLQLYDAKFEFIKKEKDE